MATVESFLTRKLDVRFIDARVIATEARLSLGIQGYPTRDQLGDLRTEAIRIFCSKSIDEQRALQQLNIELESIKVPNDSVTSSVDGSEHGSVMSGEVSRSSGRRHMRNLFHR